jgi:hypothetical protein
MEIFQFVLRSSMKILRYSRTRPGILSTLRVPLSVQKAQTSQMQEQKYKLHSHITFLFSRLITSSF